MHKDKIFQKHLENKEMVFKKCVQIMQTAGYYVTHMVDVRLYYFKANLCAAHISRGLNMVGLYCEKIKILKGSVSLCQKVSV